MTENEYKELKKNNTKLVEESCFTKDIKKIYNIKKLHAFGSTIKIWHNYNE